MPVVSDFPIFTNRQAFDAGLILQEAPEISTNEFGLREVALELLCATELGKKFTPERGTPCSDFVAGDDDTLRLLRIAYAGMAAQTSRFRPDANCPGVSILEVTCQGAKFPDLKPGDALRTAPGQFIFTPISSSIHGSGVSTTIPGAIAVPPSFVSTPWTPSSRTKASVSFLTYNADNPNILVPRYQVSLDYYSIDLHYEYMCRIEPSDPIFLQSDYPIDKDGYITVDPFGRKKRITISQITAIPVIGTVTDGLAPAGYNVAIKPSDYLPWITFTASNARFDITPAGQFFHVIETNTLSITGKAPSNTVAFASA